MENKKYIIIDKNTPILQNGLTDMRDRLLDFLRVSKYYNLIPILPKMTLLDKHTNKKNSLLNDYIELPDNILEKLPDTDISNVFIWTLKDNWLSNDTFFQDLRKKTFNKIFDEKYYTHLPYKKKFKKNAEKIISDLEKPICIIKVRRTDYLNLLPQIKLETTPENICSLLINKEKELQTKFGTVYIMTDEKDTEYFQYLYDFYNIKQYFHFPILKELKKDNYALYAVETFIRDLACYRISMFKTQNRAKMDGEIIPNYYHGSISSIGGFQ
tara:strand:- start:69 stop:878 length:810 start_codon:yes stop_codon:yes gene_type:complete